MNEPRSHPNESKLKDRMPKKGRKELKVTTYTNGAPSFFGDSIIETLKLSVLYLKQFYVGVTS